VRLLGATLRVRVIGADTVAPLWRARRPVLYTVWHGRILLAPWLNERLRRTHGARAAVVLASRSRDGELVAQYVERFGQRVVRGSSSRGGAMAARALTQALQAGDDVVVVPDGPRGPARTMAPGVAALAVMTGVPVVPLGIGATPAVTLQSWDRFQIPLPFARVTMVFGAPIEAPRDVDRPSLQSALAAALDEATALADASCRGRRPPDPHTLAPVPGGARTHRTEPGRNSKRPA
jgi:lysophospholipid acyltransferase (LPLAT)-like uncharacterized protein